jgi:hypothetical protein
MRTQIVVYQDEQPQEDGSVLRPWVAASAQKAVASQGRTLDAALANLIAWLLASEDPNDARVPDLAHVNVPPPYEPDLTTPDHLVDPSDGLVHPPPVPHHADADPAVVRRFANAAEYAGAVKIPEGWEVRVA